MAKNTGKAKHRVTHHIRLDGLRPQLERIALWHGVEKVRAGAFIFRRGGGSSVPLWELRKTEFDKRKLTFKVLGNNGIQEVIVIGDHDAIIHRLFRTLEYKLRE